jgi:hypothetical protein
MMIIEHSKYTKLDHLPHFQEKLRIYLPFEFESNEKKQTILLLTKTEEGLKRQNPKKIRDFVFIYNDSLLQDRQKGRNFSKPFDK